MNLSRSLLQNISSSQDVVLPSPAVFELPEKVLQFGTGVLLRGLPDFIINNANNNNVFNGRIVMIKSTSTGSADAFTQQDGLYTVCVRGIDNGKKVSENHLVASVSRVLSAATEWNKVLECAANPDMQVVISNTTEVGIVLVKDNIHADPPESFPGKLLSFLYHRFKFFKGDPEKGMVIIPTELIPSNADKLLSIVLELAHTNNLEISFIDWLENANHFCNSLVDRIVPGKLSATEQEKIFENLGYNDELLIMSEVYSLWAIQSSNERVKSILSFADGRAVLIAPDISIFRELKLRLLNAPHTFSCGLAHLAGFLTVKNAMDNELFESFIKGLMYHEIIPTIVNDELTRHDAERFAEGVLDRYRNSFIDHAWLAITLQYSSKMYLRNVALIKNFIITTGDTPSHMALGMAAHILFMKSHRESDGTFYGTVNDKKYKISDDNALFYHNAWKENEMLPEKVVTAILSKTSLWDYDLTVLPGFAKAVTHSLYILMEKGPVAAIEDAVQNKLSEVNEK